MYLRAVHAEQNIPALRAFIKAHPLGTFTTAIESPQFPFLQSSHIPFFLDVKDEQSETEFGILRGHMARANPQAKALIDHFTSTSSPSPATLSRDVLILFNEPNHHYVSPAFYRETKPTTGKTVPTWNYAAVQAYGKLKVYYDAKVQSTDDYLTNHVSELSQFGEVEVMGHGKDGMRVWEVDDAPKPYIEVMKKAIIGIEIEITDLGGKWKMSQESTAGDRQGVIDGFRSLGTDVGLKVAEMVEESGAKKDAASTEKTS
ncbi:hypothetical protein V5O48_007398 [Marasmius crinis-equi]|uniref:Transcriptional regulator n=1 Tax=Marasmius crinis-equi TaxID=585013 RepID=A0ABR3FGV4_9AGAR